MKNITFGDTKWLPKSGTHWHDWLILSVMMLNLHCHVQCACACNLKTVCKQKLPFDVIENDCIQLYLFLRKFMLKIQQLSITCYVSAYKNKQKLHNKHKCHLLL